MATFIQDGAVTAGSVNANEDLAIKSVILTAGSADATLTLLSNGVVKISLKAKAGETAQLIYPTGGNQYGSFQLIHPVTITTAGTGVWARIDY